MSMSAAPAGEGHAPADRAGEGGTGILYVVATPIGNLADLGQRARTVLGAVDVVVAEDTRHTGRLLAHHAIAARLESLHEHNERRRAPEILDRLLAGTSFALVSDAGTPLVSDPGFVLVRDAAEAGVQVVPVPGPSAFLCALSVAGLPVERFAFEGFLPAARGPRAARLEGLADDPRTLVFHEAPHRVAASLEAMCAAFGGGRRVVIARELTKRHETIVRTTLAEAASRLGAPRGEYVLVVAGRERGREIPAARPSGPSRSCSRPCPCARRWTSRPARPGCRASACIGLLSTAGTSGKIGVGVETRAPVRQPDEERANSTPTHGSRLRSATARRILARRESAGQPLRRVSRRGGKSGLRRAGCQVTPGGREPTESATENIPPAERGQG